MGLGGRIVSCAKVEKISRQGTAWALRLANGVTVAADKIIIATNAHTGDFWPRLRRTFIPARTPQVVSCPLSNADRAAILPGGHIMSDTRNLTLGVRLHPDGRLHLGGGGGTAGAERPGPYEALRRQARVLFPRLGALAWKYSWSGFMAMTPDRYPRLFHLAPGIGAVLGYSGRGLAMATIMGRELAEWAVGRAEIDDLALPCSPLRTLPYHFAHTLIGEAAIAYYGAKDRFFRA
jgi:glycine/D-amino acid oxidase-like deaminating enzyme